MTMTDPTNDRETRELAEEMKTLREAFMAEMQALASRRHAALASLVALFDRHKAEAIRKKLTGGS